MGSAAPPFGAAPSGATRAAVRAASTGVIDRGRTAERSSSRAPAGAPPSSSIHRFGSLMGPLVASTLV